MHQEGVQPNPITYMSVLDVGTNVDALEAMDDVL